MFYIHTILNIILFFYISREQYFRWRVRHSATDPVKVNLMPPLFSPFPNFCQFSCRDADPNPAFRRIQNRFFLRIGSGSDFFESDPDPVISPIPVYLNPDSQSMPYNILSIYYIFKSKLSSFLELILNFFL